jgi:hypothetical protein
VLQDLLSTLESLGIGPMATGAAAPSVHVEARRVRVVTEPTPAQDAEEAVGAG